MKTTRSILIVTWLCFTLSCVGQAAELSVASPKDVGMSAEKLAGIEPIMQGLINDKKIPGATVVIARKGKIAFFETYGMMDIEAKKPMAKNTILRFYSMSKPITSVAAMILYDEGKIKLDAPVSKYVPQFKGQKVYAESGNVDPRRPMTVRDLLRHTSGLTYGFFGDTAVDKMYKEKVVFDWQGNLEDMADKLGEIPLLYQPGTKWHYGVSTDMLGYVVEKASGQPLDKFLRQRIFEPLGMKDTAFYVPAEKVDRFAVCYGKDLSVYDDPAKSRYIKKATLCTGGGGLLSTAPDYMRFCQMLLNKGQLDGKRLLRTETVEMMTKNQLPEGVSRGNNRGFGLGFSVRTKDTKFPKGEYGWGGLASTHFWISPRDELIVIALSQIIPSSSGKIEETIKPIIYDSILK